MCLLTNHYYVTNVVLIIFFCKVTIHLHFLIKRKSELLSFLLLKSQFSALSL